MSRRAYCCSNTHRLLSSYEYVYITDGRRVESAVFIVCFQRPPHPRCFDDIPAKNDRRCHGLRGMTEPGNSDRSIFSSVLIWYRSLRQYSNRNRNGVTTRAVFARTKGFATRAR